MTRKMCFPKSGWRGYPVLLVLLFFCHLPFDGWVQPKAIRVIDSGFIFTSASFGSCHASTILPLGNGEVLASWFGGSHEGHKDVSIWISRFRSGSWSVPEKVADGIVSDSLRYPCWNPVLVKNAEGKVLLFYKVGPNPREWWGMVMTSADNGRRWTKPRKLPNGMLGPIKNKSLLLPGGDWLHPSSSESLDEKVWKIHLERSDGDGVNWKKIDIDCDSFGVIQPSILLHPNGVLQLLSRSRQQVVVSTFSSDGGFTWSPLARLNVPNPNSGSDAVTLKDGRHLLVYNPMLAGKDWWEGRSTLSLAASKDGIQWEPVLTLEQHAKGEFSYPAIVQDDQGDVWITYTYDRQRIKYLRLQMN